ncbi:putative Reductase, transmembrane subunit [uncultured delta proteobacterium]|uniref:Putative Reductase, transmembrane subunit n=1 Tax=uncultured delta proteobacterium TaxID=34034 RepID=A0A212KEK6_9DELT|nr:putative Reductase, transmembrane subunit [uncultured delta proteobacterium]
MMEKLLQSSSAFKAWIAGLLLLVLAGTVAYVCQLVYGLSVTNLSRDVSWGFYIAQFSFLGGVAASTLILLIPTYFHGFAPFRKILICSMFMAVAATVMALLFIIVDLGQPQRALNVILHPSPSSLMFWDMVTLNAYLILSIVIGWVSLECEKNGLEPPKWITTMIYVLAIAALSTRIVGAFLFSGLPGRHYWLTAILAPRFLASAFSAGPALLLLMVFILRRLTGFDPGKQAVRSLAMITAYAMAANVFFFLLELFTAFYSQVPGHMHAFTYLFSGHGGHGAWINGWMWFAVFAALFSLALLIPPGFRDNENILPFALVLVVIANWIDKGLSFMIGGFTPNPFGTVTDYYPSLAEVAIGIGIFAIGLAILSCLWKIVLDVKKDAGTW